VSASSIDILLDSLLDILAGISTADGIWIVPLIKPKFFEVPENVGRDAERFLLTISTRPSDAKKVYDAIAQFRPSSDIAFTYVAFTCQQHCDTITLSSFAKSNAHMIRFVDQELKEIQGIVRVNVTPMIKSKRLLPYADMVHIIKTEVDEMNVAKPMMDLSDLS